MKKSKKRDKTQRAFNQGLKSGMKGHSKEICPYMDDQMTGMWLGGWRQGHVNYLNGYISPFEE